MPENRLGPVTMQDVQIIFRNFAGNEGPINQAGDRNFSVLLPDDVAPLMEKDGWNVKYLKKREDDDPTTPLQAFLPVAVSFKNRPPRVVMITGQNRTTLGEAELELLDWADIESVDLIVNPYSWAVRDATGIKAYAKSLFVKVRLDELELKYQDLNDITPGRKKEEPPAWEEAE